MRILSSDEASRIEVAAQTTVRPLECLQAGVFTDVQVAAVRQAAQGVLPAGSWLVDTAVEPARWIVYLGKYDDVQTLTKKRAELRALNVRLEPLTNPALELGLSLGGFDSEAGADEALTALGKQGVRTARVVQERAELRGSVLRIPAVDDAIKARLDELKTVLGTRPLRACR